MADIFQGRNWGNDLAADGEEEGSEDESTAVPLTDRLPRPSEHLEFRQLHQVSSPCQTPRQTLAVFPFFLLYMLRSGQCARASKYFGFSLVNSARSAHIWQFFGSSFSNNVGAASEHSIGWQVVVRRKAFQALVRATREKRLPYIVQEARCAHTRSSAIHNRKLTLTA